MQNRLYLFNLYLKKKKPNRRQKDLVRLELKAGTAENQNPAKNTV